MAKLLLLFALFFSCISAASYWDNNLCNDVQVTFPNNESYPIMWQVGVEGQDTVYTYEYPKSEIFSDASGQTQSFKGGNYKVYPGSTSKECGQVQFITKITDESGNDVTAQMSNTIYVTDNVVPGQLWTVTINPENANQIAPGTNYALVVVIFYADLTVDPTTWKKHMKITPIAIQEEQAPLIDLAPVKAIVDSIVAMVDPIVQEYFWQITVGTILIGGFAAPTIAILGLVLLLVSNPTAFVGMWWLTIPATALFGAWLAAFGVLFGPPLLSAGLFSAFGL